MKNRLSMIKALVFACGIALTAFLTACSGSGAESLNLSAPTTVSGIAEAPGGMIAQFEENKSCYVAAIEYVFPGAAAGITGLLPVTGATVQLIRIDDSGVQLGDVLAETVTTISGNYSLALPTGVSLAGNLIVRITGNGGASMSAMVVDQVVDINPMSQFVLNKFVDENNLVLADLAINEVVALSGKVDEFDLTATSDLSTMLAQLEAEIGQFVENEIAVINAVPDDGTAVAAAVGNWHAVEMGLGLHDIDNMMYGAFATNLSSEELTLTDSGIIDPNLTITSGPVLVDTFTKSSVDSTLTVNIFHEIDIGTAGENFSANIDANNNISLSSGLQEKLETVDTLTDPDGPDFGWRYPPRSEQLQAVAGGNIYVSVTKDAAIRYQTVDTNADGVKDAIDPANRVGDEAGLDLSLIMKQGSGMSITSLNGDYGGVFLNFNLDTVPEMVVNSTVGILGFDGAGKVTRDQGALDVREITRTPATPPTVGLAHVQSTEPASSEEFGYTVSDTGQLTLIVDPGVDEPQGYASNDGSVLAFVTDDSSGNPVTNVNSEMQVFVKLGTVMDTEMAGATYKLYALAVNASTDGSSKVFSIGNGLAAFNADASAVDITGVDRGVMRGSDVSQIEAVTADVINERFYIDSFTSQGKVTVSSTTAGAFGTETTTLQGFVSGDKKMLVLRLFTDLNGAAQEYDLGLVIGVKQ